MFVILINVLPCVIYLSYLSRVGLGCVGCEMLKDWAMMGVGTGTKDMSRVSSRVMWTCPINQTDQDPHQTNTLIN